MVKAPWNQTTGDSSPVRKPQRQLQATPPREPTSSRRCFASNIMKTYSQEQLIQLLTEWMVKYRGSPMELNDEVRDKWYQEHGLIAHFIRDHFPTP